MPRPAFKSSPAPCGAPFWLRSLSQPAQMAARAYDFPNGGDEENEDLYKVCRHLHQAVSEPIFEQDEFEERFERFAGRYGVDLSVEG